MSLLAEQYGLAIVTIGENSEVLDESNNNSMCRFLMSSPEFSPKCAEYCGNAFNLAIKTGKEVEYKCYAGLNCMAIPGKNKKSATIIGRTFLRADDYRQATTRAGTGDWRHFPSSEFFGNTLFSGSLDDLKKMAREVSELDHYEATEETETKPETRNLRNEPSFENRKSVIKNIKLREWRSLVGSLLETDYKQACRLIAQFVKQFYSISSLAWLERRDHRLEAVFASGYLQNRKNDLGIAADNEYLLAAVSAKTPLELRERQATDDANEPRTVWLFPFAAVSEVQNALIIGDDLEGKNVKRQILRFCRRIAPQLEILRLREQISQTGVVERAVEKFNDRLNDVDSEDFWSHLIKASAELMHAERSSLLVFDERTQNFTVRAATGIRADSVRHERENLGGRVAKGVINEGKVAVVGDVSKTSLPTAPPDRQYKSNSFISYPITIGKRKIGVLNLTDKADGKSYDDVDLKLLELVMPALAMTIDRAALQHQAGELRQLSVTDALTGLLNRRYLEERLTEETNRSNRHGFPLSFLMIDVDDFKKYNDNFGHLEGDHALRAVGACLRETLRGADVAARYGGEEFSILLPQTSSAEAEVIAERIRERVANECVPNRKITISIGIASCSSALNSSEDLITAADKALYEAKRKGRNNVQVYGNLQKNSTAGTQNSPGLNFKTVQ